MNRSPPTPPETVAGEISALISRLHETSQRLEELTSGEIDTVSDAEGRTFVLRRAQEDLRLREASRQVAILNALPAHIALLNAEGVVVAVNEGWRQFAEENGLQGPTYGIGVNYLAICDRASGEESTSAQQAALTIRAVLAGGAQAIRSEYPCHSPAEKRWFLMTATSLPGFLGLGAVVMHVDITQRVLGEDALRRSEEEFRAMFELASVGLAQADPQTGRLLRVNQKICEITGYSVGEMLEMRISEFTHPEDRAEDSVRFQQALRAESADYRMEKRYIRKDGSIAWVNVNMTILRDAAHNPVRTMAAIEDITERKRSEEASHRSAKELELERARLVMAQRVAKVGSWETDLSTREVVWSEETHRIHETDSATFPATHKAFLALVHPDDRDRVDEAFERSLDQTSPSAIEHRLLLADGRIKFVEERWQVLADASGTPVRAIGTCQDITERKTAEGKIAHLSRVKAMLSGISALIVRVRDRDELLQEACWIAVDAGGFRMALIAVVDRQTKALEPVASAGKDPELLAAVAGLLKNPETAPKTMLARAIRGKTPVVSNDSVNDSRLLLPTRYLESGVRSVAVLPLLVADEAVGVLALYSSEVEFFHEEEMKLLSELANDIAFCMGAIRSQALKEKADEALRASLKEKEALLKEVHHRVKNNMQVITSLLRLEANRIDHPITRSVLKDMQNRILAMAALHEALYRSNNFAQVDLSSYLKELTGQLARSLVASPGQVRFVLDLFPVGLDLDQAVPCGLIVNELVSNAMKHGLSSGRPGEVRVGMEWAGGGLLRLRVADDGVGLPADFDARRRKSLGLQLVADLARQLGGNFHIGPGPAAIFEVTFEPSTQGGSQPPTAPSLEVRG